LQQYEEEFHQHYKNNKLKITLSSLLNESTYIFLLLKKFPFGRIEISLSTMNCFPVCAAK